MKKYIPLLILIIAIIAILSYCLKNSNAINLPIDEEITNKVPVQFPIQIENNSILNFINGKGEYTTIKKGKEEQTFSFRNNSAKQVEIEIIPENDSANLRINQIILPNGESDGQFGRKLLYDLKEKGLYQIKIGESLMQGEPFEGKYTLKLQLK